MMAQRDVQEEYLRLRGQMLYVHEWRAIIYLATPVFVSFFFLFCFCTLFIVLFFSLENLDVMFNTGLFINDLSMHDSSRDLVLAGTQQSAELKLALDQVHVSSSRKFNITVVFLFRNDKKAKLWKIV